MSEQMILPPRFLARPGEGTFKYQDRLPSLPVPDLQQTLDIYLESVRPFLTESELRNTRHIVQEFGNGIGRELQQKLLKKAETSRNWLEKWWEKYAYLVTRTSHTPYLVMTSFLLELPSDVNQVDNSAIFTWYALKYWELLRREKLAIDRGGGKTVWCMDQYRRMYNDCKTPDYNFCQLNHYFKTDREGTCPQHMTVIHRGRIFTFDVLDDNGELLTKPEIQCQLQRVVDCCKGRPRGPGVGTLTAAPRDDWKRLRDHLIEIHPGNLSALEAIQTSIFALVLDDGKAPTSPIEELKESLFGDIGSRWFDKSMGAVAFKNGRIGMWGDHSPADAMVIVAMTEFVTEGSLLNDGLWKGPMNVRPLSKPTEQEFRVDGTILKGIVKAGEDYLKLGTSTTFAKKVSKKFGSDYIKSLGVHPDPVAQLVLQLAYFRLHKKPAPTYETASTRAFYHARTETVRSCTVEAATWCLAMTNASVKDSERRKLFGEAYAKHQALMKQGMRGQTIDRHLLGLQLIALEDGLAMPALFTDPAYTKSGGGGNFILSTSFLGSSHLNGSMVPMCHEGYTVFYCMRPDEYQFSASGWIEDDTDPEGLMEEVVQSFDSVLDLLKSAKTNQDSKL